MTKAISILLLLCGLGGAAQAQMTEAEIGKRLIGKPLFLRGFWANDSLKFDASGVLLSKSNTKSFTLCGVEVQKVDLQRDKLVLEGRRIGVDLKDKAHPARVVLSTSSKEQKDESIKLEIAAPANSVYRAAIRDLCQWIG